MGLVDYLNKNLSNQPSEEGGAAPAQKPAPKPTPSSSASCPNCGHDSSKGPGGVELDKDVRKNIASHFLK